MRVPAIAEAVCRQYLAAFDTRHPGLLNGLYLVGSIALDDFHPGRSDIDFVAVTRRPVELAEIVPLHAGLDVPGRPYFDELFVTAGELLSLPGPLSRGVAVLDDMPLADSGAERHAVTWLTLARHGVAIRGAAPDPSWIAGDMVAAQAYSRANLRTYWHDWIALRRANSRLSEDELAWSILGVSRLHALIREAQILSKTQAGRYALTRFPRHRAIIERALAWRGHADRPGLSPEQRQAAFAFLDQATAEACA